jgi:hypothetical protein
MIAMNDHLLEKLLVVMMYQKTQENIKDFINFTGCAMRSKNGNLLVPYHVRTS